MESLENKPGVYFLSPYDSSCENLVQLNLKNKKDYLLIKIGNSKNLQSRLESYLLYYPLGFKLFGIILTNVPENETLYTEVENFLHAYLRNKRRNICLPHSRKNEWFILSLYDVERLLQLIKNNFEKTTVYHYSLFYPFFSNTKCQRTKASLPFKDEEKIDEKFPLSPMSKTQEDFLEMIEENSITLPNFKFDMKKLEPIKYTTLPKPNAPQKESSHQSRAKPSVASRSLFSDQADDEMPSE